MSKECILWYVYVYTIAWYFITLTCGMILLCIGTGKATTTQEILVEPNATYFLGAGMILIFIGQALLFLKFVMNFFEKRGVNIF